MVKKSIILLSTLLENKQIQSRYTLNYVINK